LCISRIAGVAVARGEFLSAVRLFGIEDAIFDTQQLDPRTMREVQEDGEREIARKALDAHSFDRAYAEGRAMSEKQGVEFALAQV
jgi:hypothetical protein